MPARCWDVLLLTGKSTAETLPVQLQEYVAMSAAALVDAFQYAELGCEPEGATGASAAAEFQPCCLCHTLTALQRVEFLIVGFTANVRDLFALADVDYGSGQ